MMSAALFFAACKKMDSLPYYAKGTAPVLSANVTSVYIHRNAAIIILYKRLFKKRSLLYEKVYKDYFCVLNVKPIVVPTSGLLRT